MDHPLPTRGPSTTRARTRRRGAALLATLVLLVAVVAGCSTVEAFTDLDTALQDAGFTDTQVNVANGDPVVLTVSADAPAGDSPEEAQTAAAEVVWTTFPRQFEEARISIDGDSRTVTADQLQEQFGDRPAGLDDQALADDVNRVAITAVVGILVTGLVVMAVAGLTVLVVVRRRRRRAPSALPVHGAPWAPPAHLGGPPGAPVPPPAGWGDPQGAVGPPQQPPAGAPPAWEQPRPPTPTAAPAPTLSAQEARADARRRGRPARGPRPPEAQIPRGWG